MPLPPETFPSTSFIAFSIFNWAIPNIIVWSLVIILFLLACVLRLPKIFEPEENDIEV